MNRLILTIAACMLLYACGAEKSESLSVIGPAERVVEVDPVYGINWFDGTVEDAFASAIESGKPIYLYWGAEWCPPCHAISATVFKSPEFIERSKLFVPVYLDGDDENAQQYGERFGVLGYPTMIVFDSNGVELTRIPGGIDMQAYANILDLTLSNTSPASDLTAALMRGNTDLSSADCTLLAYNSWGQNSGILAEYDEAELFGRMHEACPEDMPIERSILFLAWFDSALTAAEDEDKPIALSETQLSNALAQINAVLADHDLLKANIFSVLLDGARYTAVLTAADSEARTELSRKFHGAFEALKADESVYMRERIYTLAGKIDFERIDDAEAALSEELMQEIRDMTAWADESTPSVYERQPIINALANVLNEAGMDDVAKPLLLAELERSKQAYYFMPDIADIEQRAGNNDIAIEWLKKAYDSTRGPATRFQWGYYYLSGLLEMAPRDVERIHETTVALITELQESGGFYQRPKAQLRRLEQGLIVWSEENGRGKALADIRDAVQAICKNAASPDESCEAFLESA